MMSSKLRLVAILVAITALLLAACGPQATEEPTRRPSATPAATEEAATEEATEVVTEAATEEVATEVVTEAATEEATEVVTEEATEVMTEEATEVATELATEAATEEMAVEATEVATEEAVAEVEMVSYVKEAETYTLGFSYPSNYVVTESSTTDLVRLNSGDDALVVVGPNNYAAVLGTQTFENDAAALAHYLDRAGYGVGEAATMDMGLASNMVTLARRNQEGYATLVSVGEGLNAVVIALAPDYETSTVSAVGAAIMGSLSYTVIVPPTEEPTPEPVVEVTPEATEVATEAPAAEVTEVPTEAAATEAPAAETVTYTKEAETYSLSFDYSGAYAVTESSTAAFVRLNSGDDAIVVAGPDNYAAVLGSNTFDDDAAALAYYLDRSGYTVGEANEDGSVAVTLARRNQEGHAMLVSVGEGLNAVVIALAPNFADSTVGADAASIASSLSYTVIVPPTEEPTPEAAVEAPQLTIGGLAIGNSDLSTLANAAVRAGLFGTLNGTDEFTVFAPTNAAFEAALASMNTTLADVVADREHLTSILTYHVVAGKLTSDMLVAGTELTTVNGATLTVEVAEDGTITLVGAGSTATVVTADILASNGVVHVIDTVLVPPAGE